ncbi:probable crossover junction endonuclease EME2 isoform X1 [Myotis myotis]|nr:probable crossover junction endonuclease EME2 isoform X1 [Myotis myotis]
MACPRLPAALREAGPPPEAAGVLYKSLRARPEAEEAGQAMAKVGSRRVGRSCRGRGQRRPTTWEISDSDTEGPVGAGADSEAAVRARDPAEQRRAEAEALRLLRPKQALRRLAVRVDPAILEDAGADILMEALGSLGCEYHIEPQRPARSLRWSRVKPEPCPCSVPPEVWAAGEQELLRLLEPEEFLQGVFQLTQICGPACSVPWISPESPTCLHLAVIGLDAYLWSHQPNAQEMQQPESPGVARAEVAVGWPEVEEALVLLQLWANLDVLLVASWQELSQHVCAFTKALAQRPFKQFQESGTFSFCTAGRWTAGERVTKDGTGLRGAWWRQIRQFNRVSPAVADAVVTAFPSPRLLQQAYLACSTDQERLALLADLPVKVDEGARPRRVGPDLSRRICLFLTSTNPDLLLDLSS